MLKLNKSTVDFASISEQHGDAARPRRVRSYRGTVSMTRTFKAIKWLLFAIFLSAPLGAQAQTVKAASCSSSDVQSAINSASAGQTVDVPAGSCSWPGNSVNLKKAITLQGAGAGVTNITLTADPSFVVAKQASGVTRITGFTFSNSNNTTFPDAINVQGTWPGGQPVIFQNNSFVMNNSRMLGLTVAGGVIISHNTFTGGWNDFAITVKDLTNTNSWTTADSMGTHDSSGLLNVYVEDNTFKGQSNGAFDCDDNCRMVVRHNTFSESGGFNSHGEDSSPYGMRHFEIYGNSFLFPDKTCTAGNSSLSNINFYIWIRGATGVIFDNNFDHLSSTCWGTKTEIKLSNRGAEDDRPQGTCSATHYPTPHQLGQNHNGSNDFTDPIWFWSNNGATISVSAGWAWGNPCGFDWNTYFQWGRDGSNSSLNLSLLSLSVNGVSVSGLGGSPKPGYTSYAYPHPLVQGSTSSNAPAAPSNLSAIIQ